MVILMVCALYVPLLPLFLSLSYRRGCCTWRAVFVSGRRGVRRYVLELSGPSAESFLKESGQEPILSTCGGW